MTVIPFYVSIKDSRVSLDEFSLDFLQDSVNAISLTRVEIKHYWKEPVFT
jgi:hypothetical protein